jgi:hypothetical protein
MKFIWKKMIGHREIQKNQPDTRIEPPRREAFSQIRQDSDEKHFIEAAGSMSS